MERTSIRERVPPSSLASNMAQMALIDMLITQWLSHLLPLCFRMTVRRIPRDQSFPVVQIRLARADSCGPDSIKIEFGRICFLYFLISPVKKERSRRPCMVGQPPQQRRQQCRAIFIFESY